VRAQIHVGVTENELYCSDDKHYKSTEYKIGITDVVFVQFILSQLYRITHSIIMADATNTTNCSDKFEKGIVWDALNQSCALLKLLIT